MRRLFAGKAFDAARRAVVLGVALLMLSTSMIFTGAQDDDALYLLPAQRDYTTTSSSLAFISDGQFIIATNMLSGTASIINPFASRLLIEIPVGRDPRSVAVTPDSTRAAVTNRGDGTLSVIDIRDQRVTATIPVGILPYGVVMLDNATAAVSIQGTHEIVFVDIAAGAVLERVSVPHDPTGMALWGDLLYITHLWNGDISLMHVPQRRVVDTIALGPDLGLSQSIAIDTQRGTAYLPQTRLNTAARTPTYDTLMFPVVNVIGLRGLTFQPSARIAVNVADRPVNMPFAAVVDPVRRWLYVANAGSNAISVIDLTTNLAVTHIRVNANPRGLLITRSYGTLYVHNMLDSSISVIDTVALRVSEIIPISTSTPPADIFIGAQLFHTAADPRMTTDSWVSCASCHFDGLSGGRVWQGMSAAGPADTPLLFNLAETLPYTHRGEWDELADVEHKIRGWMAGQGLIDGDVFPPTGDSNGGRSLDLDALGAYLLTLTGPPVPQPDATLIEQGQALFEQLECAACHPAPTFTDGQLHDVDTGGGFVTPSLRWLYYSAPYLHDGRAMTLFDLFIMPGAHRLIDTRSIAEIEALVAYLESLPAPE